MAFHIKISLLGLLCFMHYFWIVLMLRIMVLDVCIKGKTEDTHAKIKTVQPEDEKNELHV